jgi:hypothetical protein
MDFGLKFEFARYLAVYRGIPRHTALPLPGGKNVAVGKKNPGVAVSRWQDEGSPESSTARLAGLAGWASVRSRACARRRRRSIDCRDGDGDRRAPAVGSSPTTRVLIDPQRGQRALVNAITIGRSPREARTHTVTQGNDTHRAQCPWNGGTQKSSRDRCACASHRHSHPHASRRTGIQRSPLSPSHLFSFCWYVGV